MDLTNVIQATIALVITLCSTFLVPYLKTKKNNENVLIAINIANQLVRAARELDITKDLIELGKNKADYAFDEMKRILEEKNIHFSDEEIRAYIKSGVTQLRIELNAIDKSLTEEKVNA